MTTTQTGQPFTSLTGSDVLQLAGYLANLLAQQQQKANDQAGYYDPTAYYGNAQTLLPTLARQDTEAQIGDAQRKYALDAQRFGLSVAQQAYDQRMGEIKALTDQQGPGDWLKYNYTIHNLPYTGTPNPSPQAAAGPSFDLSNLYNFATQQQPWAGSAPTQPTQTQTATAILRSRGLGPDGQPLPTSTSQMPNAPASFTPPPAQTAPSGPQPTQQQPTGEALQTYLTQMGSAGQLPQAYDTLKGGGYTPALARGGTAMPMLGMGRAMAVIGDPQRAGQPNPELAWSDAPIHVAPLRQMPEHLARFASNMPHAATGGTISGPWLTGLTGGGSSFSGSGLGAPWGQAPFSYQNYQQLLPSEQAMLQGYVNTPTSLGGLGGYFPDELARSQRASAVGNSYEWWGPSQYQG